MAKRGSAYIGLLLMLVVAVSAASFFVFFKASRQSIDGSECSGKGSVTLTAPPMKAEDVSMIIPYGGMVNEHVTPIDHEYFAPADYNSPRDAYKVYAIADGTITEIQHRTSGGGSFYQGQAPDEYRMVFTYTCTFQSYYDLLTSLSPDIKAQFDAYSNGGSARVTIPVKAGQVIGRIGGRTLDFAVWDKEKMLSGFIVPQHYSGEPWKIYTADPLDYASPQLKAFMLSKNPRKVEPRSGKIDYDIDGKLSGNWFVVNSGGYSGTNHDQNAWRNHLAFAPNNYDPSLWEVSIGSWGENGGQFAISADEPQPENVDIQSGLIKYRLVQPQLYVDGQAWDNKTSINLAQTITARASNQSQGCILLQMTGQRTVKAESFKNASCGVVHGFTKKAQIYAR